MTPEVRMHPLDEICLMCCKLIDGPGSTPIFESPDLINLFTGVIGIQLKREEYLPENICLTCSFTLYRMLEIQRMTKRNIMHHKMNHQYRNVGEKSKLLLGATTFSPEPTAIRNSNPNGLIISEVRGHVQVADDHFLYSSYEEDCTPDGYIGVRSPKRDPAASPSSNNSRNSTRLLRPIYMQVENVRDTESDGAIYGNTTSFQCDMCSKIFARRNHMTRHMNSHRARSRAGSRASEERKKRVYRCKICLEEFSERRMAIKHKMSHQKSLSCPSCSRVFHLRRELDWHEAECVGRVNAGATNRGRRSRRLRPDRSVDEDFDEVSRDSLRLLTKTPTLSERLQSVQKWCNSSTPADASNADFDGNSHHEDDDARSTISRFTSVSQKTALTCISSRSGWSASNISIRTDYSYKSAKTVRTLKEERDYLQSCRVTRSIASRMKKIDLEIKIRELPHRSYGPSRSAATSRRHFDITRRAKPARKNRRMTLPDAFICDCGFSSKNLKDFMEHEVNVHKKLPLFTCRECNERFTQRRFLEKHQESHNKTYTCVWCFAKFLNESDLKTHLELHALSSTPCGFCEAAFVSQHELREHLEDMHAAENERMPQKSKILIRIGEKRRHEVQQEKSYRSRDLPQKAQPEDHRKRARTYTRYRAIRLGTVGREKSSEEEGGSSQVENGVSEATREHILLPVAMDFCRYSTPSPQISDTHERLCAKATSTPPPSLEELGVFDTNFPLTNGITSDHAGSPEKSPYRLEEDEEDHSPIASPTGRRKRSKSRITLSQRVTRQTVAQPLPHTIGLDNVLPPYESWPLDGTAIAVKPGVLPQPCRMT
uniref:Uncharacterized protein n=2 Tax=Lutzomyia longipalpis TaxID=7200 RepID=A0A1B0CBQ0_LUTLO